MFITNIVTEEQHARTQLAWMVQDHEWFCNAVTTVFKSCMGVTKKREILDKIADNFAVLQNRAIHSLECPTGVVVDKVVEEQGMRQSLTAWGNQAGRRSLVWSVVCEFWDELDSGRSPEEFCVYAYRRNRQILGLAYVDISQPSMWSIQALVVDPSCQGQGIGSYLVNQIAQNAPCQIVVSPVVSAWSFYAKQGFCFDVNGLVRNDERMYRVAAPHLTQQEAQ